MPVPEGGARRGRQRDAAGRAAQGRAAPRDASARAAWRRHARALAAALVLGTASPAVSLHPATRHYGWRDGLPQSRVTAVAQDARGLLWAGTKRGGLARYDGQSWRVLDTGDGLPSNDVRWIARAPDGTLFVGTAAGFGRLAGDRYEPLGPAAGTTERLVRTLEASTPGRLWVGQRTGLLLWADGEGSTRARVERGGRQADVQWLAPDGSGGVFAATDLGLAHVEPPPGLGVSWVGGLPDGEVTAVAVRADGSLAAGVLGAGLFAGRPGAFVRIGDDERPGPRVIALREDGEGGLLVGTSGRGAHRCRTACTPLTGDDVKPDGIVFDVVRDREGVLWFATDTGLGKRVDSPFWSYDAADGFPQVDALYGMAETADGAIWVAASPGTVIRVDRAGAARPYGRAEGLPRALVTHVFTPPGRRTVLACTRAGLFRLEGERFVKEALAPGVPEDLDTALDTGAGRYVASWNQGVYYLQGGTATRLPAPVGAVVDVLAPLADGRVACGGEGTGVVIVDRGQPVARYTTRDGLPSDKVNGILEDSGGALWVATDAGVWCRRPDGTHLVIARDAGLPGGYVYWIVQTRDGSHWFGTNLGVVRRARDGALERFTTRDGLDRNECSPGSAFVDSRGRLFVGTSSLSVFEGRPVPGLAAPLVLVEAGPRPGALGAQGALRVPPGAGSVRFHFASPSFVDEEATTFRTRLVGASDAWETSEPGVGTARYAGLRPGSYRFEVEAVTSDGRASATPATLSVVVEPAWWHRSDVRTAGLVAAILLVAAALRLRERWHARTAARLEGLVAEQTEALRRANSRLEELAATDELTGIANRRAALERLSQAIAVARRQAQPLTIALVDVDGFKAVNDSYGHPAGDDCLRWITARLASALRAADHLGRIGGDEFLAVLVATGPDGASRAAERMLAGLAADPWRPPGGWGLSVEGLGLSIGLATLKEDDASADDLVQRADRALYAAKRTGRGQVAFAE